MRINGLLYIIEYEISFNVPHLPAIAIIASLVYAIIEFLLFPKPILRASTAQVSWGSRISVAQPDRVLAEILAEASYRQDGVTGALLLCRWKHKSLVVQEACKEKQSHDVGAGDGVYGNSVCA